MKNALFVLLGIVIGVAGYYFATKAPHPNLLRPTSPTNIAWMFKEAVDVNSLYSVRALMTPGQRGSFTAPDLKAIRKYVGVGTKAEGGASYDNYEVITIGTNKPVTLWLAPPFGNNHLWQIQKITQGATLALPH